jgi:hypothetical protein
MVGTFKTIHLMPKSQVRTLALPYSPQLFIWMLVGSQSNFRYTLREVKTYKSMPLAKSASLYDQNGYSYPIWPIWPKVGPKLAQSWPKVGPKLAQFGPIDPFCHWCRLK